MGSVAGARSLGELGAFRGTRGDVAVLGAARGDVAGIVAGWGLENKGGVVRQDHLGGCGRRPAGNGGKAAPSGGAAVCLLLAGRLLGG